MTTQKVSITSLIIISLVVIEKTPTLVLLNKQDDENSMDLEECTTILKQNKFIEKIPVISVHACSAVNGTGLKESFKWLVDAYRNSESNV
jgi:predicted GTPase